MTSVNSVLMKFFKLPPAVKMVLALAGFGSLASIIFFVLPALRTQQGKIWILIIGGIALGAALLIYGVYWLVFRRRAGKLAGALEAQGPTRADEAEQQRVYREKFRAKLTELRRSGLSVYRLPWFVLIGEPGCGKTASLLHSGLDFPLGKDEVPGFGGTRNYNWWFTNDSVILDTAGRIAFQEEGTTDRIEWEFFLKLLRNHRPRCPINGIIIALPADKLLRDSADERAEKATVIRERLRQMHQALGVRFPTFLLITKMDLVGGFSEFFEEVRGDLTARNQMLGWSRPGEFQAPYDPNEFTETFDSIYDRVRAWSLRYLQRKATDEELGLIVTFPEALRQLRTPLNDYVGTIFQRSPLLEPPFFRGFYFTSAVQEGAPIFDVYAKARSGLTLPERPQRGVDSKAFFIHNFYQNKVFAEHGLVFRSAQHVTLNRRMRRIVWAGGVALFLLMIALFSFGAFGVHDLVRGPQTKCANAVETIRKASNEPEPYENLSANLNRAEELESAFKAYSGPLNQLRARSLFILANLQVPQDHVRLIHARFVLETIVEPVLRAAEERLAKGPAEPAQRKAYLDALGTYAQWYGDYVGREGRTPLDDTLVQRKAGDLGTLLNFLQQDAPVRERAVAQAAVALGTLAREPRYFGPQILDRTNLLNGARATEVLLAGIAQIKEHWRGTTLLEPTPGDPFLQYWLEFAQLVDELRQRYDRMLALSGKLRDPGTFTAGSQELATLTAGVQNMAEENISPPVGSLAEAFVRLREFLQKNEVPQTEEQRILRFADRLRQAATQGWAADLGVVRDALTGVDPTEIPQKRVIEALQQTQQDLTDSYIASLARIRSQLNVPEDREPAEYFAQDMRLVALNERPEGAGLQWREPKARLILGQDLFGRNRELINYLVEFRGLAASQADVAALDDLRRWPELLQAGSNAAGASEHFGGWQQRVAQASQNPTADDFIRASLLADLPIWKPAQLYDLGLGVQAGFERVAMGALLEQMRERCVEVVQAERLPGIARLMPGFDQADRGLPFVQAEEAMAPAPQREKPAETPQPEPDPADRRRRRQPVAAAEPTEEPGARRGGESRVGPAPVLVRYHTRDFMADTLNAYDAARTALADRGQSADAVQAALQQAAGAYIDAYFRDWRRLYGNPTEFLDRQTLGLLAACAGGETDWPAFHDTLETAGPEMLSELATRCEALVRNVVFYADAFPEQSQRNDRLYKLTVERLDRFDPADDLTLALGDLRDAAPGAGGRGASNPARTLSNDLLTPWEEYRRQVVGLGADPQGEKPDSAALRQRYQNMLTWRQIQPHDFALLAPLLDLANHGERLLQHHLQRELVQRFSQYAARFPVLEPREVHVADMQFSKLAGTPVLAPAELRNFLRDMYEFEQKYGSLFRSVSAGASDPFVARLEQGRAWLAFLYGDSPGRVLSEDPTPLKVRWAPARRDGTLSAGSVYDKLEIKMPLLESTARNAASAGVWSVRSSAGADTLSHDAVTALRDGGQEYRWSLFRTDVDYQTPAVRVFDKNATAKGTYPNELTTDWSLPARPWSFVLLAGAGSTSRTEKNIWIIPVLLNAAGETIGFDLAVEFEREYPGPIAPPPDPGQPPAMQAATRYVASR